MNAIQVNAIAYKKAEKEVQRICKKLFNTTPISAVYYGKLKESGEYIGVNSNADWFLEYIEKFPEYLIPKNIMGEREGFFLSASTNPPELLKLSESYNITNAINYIKKSEGYFEEYGFATNIDETGILDFYINNLEKLKNYIGQFREQIQPLLQDKDLIIQFPLKLFKEEQVLLLPFKYDLSELNFNHAEAHEIENLLSDREQECFRLILQRKTRQQIAEAMSISLSSVGTYLTRTMNKLNCNSRSELITLAYNKKIISLDSSSN